MAQMFLSLPGRPTTALRRPQITGTVNEASATIVVTVAGNTYNATNNGDGTWIIAKDTINELALGLHTISATFADGLGNSSTASIEVLILPTTQDLTDTDTNTAANPALNESVIDVTSGTCQAGIMSANSLSGTSLTAPEQFVTIIGGITYKLSCEELGGDATIDITLGTYYSDLTSLRIYKQEDGNLIDITSTVNLRNEANTTKLTITLTDGATYDEDNIENYEILDPIFIGLYQKSPIAPATGVGKATSVTLAIIPIIVGAIALLFNKKFRKFLSTN